MPHKNHHVLTGKYLIEWAIFSAKKIREICDILVTTDDPVLADIAVSNGSLLPWLLSNYLSTDTAGSVDGALYTLNWYENEKGYCEGLVLLQQASSFSK